jgi:hypothetical protein
MRLTQGIDRTRSIIRHRLFHFPSECSLRVLLGVLEIRGRRYPQHVGIYGGPLLEHAKIMARIEGTTIRALIERGLKLALTERRSGRLSDPMPQVEIGPRNQLFQFFSFRLVLVGDPSASTRRPPPFIP